MLDENFKNGFEKQAGFLGKAVKKVSRGLEAAGAAFAGTKSPSKVLDQVRGARASQHSYLKDISKSKKDSANLVNQIKGSTLAKDPQTRSSVAKRLLDSKAYQKGRLNAANESKQYARKLVKNYNS